MDGCSKCSSDTSHEHTDRLLAHVFYSVSSTTTVTHAFAIIESDASFIPDTNSRCTSPALITTSDSSLEQGELDACEKLIELDSDSSQTSVYFALAARCCRVRVFSRLRCDVCFARSSRKAWTLNAQPSSNNRQRASLCGTPSSALEHTTSHPIHSTPH